MPKTGCSQSSTMEVPAHTQSEVTEQLRAIVRRRRVQYFERADRWFHRLVRLAAVVHEGFWLGCLSPDDLNAVTADYYRQSQEAGSPEHNLRGFFDWETSVVARYLHPGSRILVAAAGGIQSSWAVPAR